MPQNITPAWPCKLLFFCSGFSYAVWGIGIAVIDHKFALSPQALSAALFSVSAGAIVSLSSAGRLITRIGSDKACEVGALLQAILISLIMQVNRYEVLLLVLFGFGIANAIFDTAMNAQTVSVEHQTNRSLLSGMHGFFSFGGICGSSMGGFFVDYSLPITYAFYLSGLLTLISAGISRRSLAPDPSFPEVEREATAAEITSLRLIGALAFMGLLAEGAMYDWTAIFMRDVAHAANGWISSGYTSFSAGMMFGRLGGDWLRKRYGNIAILRGSGYLAILGLGFALVKPTLLSSLSGFAMVGMGCANFIPILFKAASQAQPGSAGEAIAYVSKISYCGFLIGPVLIGLLASQYGLASALTLVACCCLLIVVMARHALLGLPA